MSNAAAVHAKAIALGKLCVQMTARGGSGHPSSGLSLAQIVTHLMYREMRHDPSDPWNMAGDRLVLSEGHAVPIVYAALADLGAAVGKNRKEARALRAEDVDGLRDLPSLLDGHPNPAEGVPFFDAATGSLGQGLSVAAGLAAGARLDNSPRRVFCIIGDGESREGQNWEALDFIVDHKLHTVCAIFNANGQGQTGYVSPQQSADALSAKLKAFGWNAQVIDGHDPEAIAGALAQLGRGDKPLAIVARTVKGWGVDELQKGNWHGKPLSEDHVAAASADLDRAAQKLAGGAADIGRPQRPLPGGARRERRDPREVKWPSFADAMKAGGFDKALAKGELGTRKAYGAALRAAGDLLPQVVALDADVSNSTFSELFAKAHPDRFFECKIAEQNMISAAAGLSAAGFIPFVNTFAKFVARAYDQIEMANISRANIKIVGSHSGISLAADGPSQMSLPDVAYFHALASCRGDNGEDPQCWVYHPADAVAAYGCTQLMAQCRGLCYMRTHRPEVPLLYAPDAKFEPRGFNVLAQGDEIALISSGYMVHIAKQAVELLGKQGRRAALIDAYCLPIDAARLVETLRRTGKRALVVEDNYGGGFGAAVSAIAAAQGDIRVASLFVQRMPKSARTPEEILDYCGVGPNQIADHALALLRRPA